MSTIIYNPIFWIFISYAIGQIIADILIKKQNVTWFEDHNYIRDKTTRWLGVLAFGWLIRHTFMGWFNKKLRLKSSANIEDLKILKTEMGYAEAGHLVAFYFLLLVNIWLIFYGCEWWYVLTFFMVNLVFNMYLVLLQQYNKRRITRLLNTIDY